MARNIPCRHVLITGSPGVGKTTLVKNVAKHLIENYSVKLNGFFTEELRQDGSRIGFDVVMINGNDRAPLSRKSEFTPAGKSRHMPMVGQYCVDVKSFEDMALPTMHLTEEPGIFVVDEIGKMEMFSMKFVAAVKHLLDSKTSTVLATVPVAKSKSLKFVDDLKRRPECQLIMVTKSNRESLIEEVCQLVINSYRNDSI